MSKYVVVITGASSGFGALSARAISRAGHTVYAGMRWTTGENANEVEAVRQFALAEEVDLRSVEMDVQSQVSVDKAIEQIRVETGRLDVVIHNAGHMSFGPSEAFTVEQLAELYDVNVLSTQRVNRAALPILRKQGKGLVVWVGSSSTRGGTPPYLGPYFAAKAAMDSLAVTYAGELTRWGIETTIVVPGVYTTGTNHFPTADHPADEGRAAEYAGGPYKDMPEPVHKGHDVMAPAKSDVADVARAIAKVVDAPFGKRPFRVTIDPADAGAEVINMMGDRVRAELFRRIGIEDLLKPHEAAQLATHH
jgi:NAD(P)-dependent dehydrogenase (short-subunit alcohol dehydrogenase family)